MTHRLVVALQRLAMVARTGRYALPLAILLAALAACDPRGSASVEQLLKRSQEQRAAGNIRASIIELKNALQKDPKNATARLLLGQTFIDLGDAASAEIELKRAQELGADAGKAAISLGEVKVLQGRFDQVLRELPVPDSASPEVKAAILELRARAHLALGQRVQAEEAFKTAIETDAKAVEPLVGAARLAMAKGGTEAANDYIARAAAIAPDNAKLLALQGELAFLKKDFEGAETFYKQVLKSHKDDITGFNAQLGIARAQLASG